MTQAWQHSRESLGRLDRAVLTDDGIPPAGAARLFAAVAGAPIAPDTLLADTAGAIVTALAG